MTCCGAAASGTGPAGQLTVHPPPEGILRGGGKKLLDFIVGSNESSKKEPEETFSEFKT